MSDKVKFPVGTRVRMKEGALDRYYVEVQRRVKGGRIGIVSGHTVPRDVPIVVLPQEGRRKEYRFGPIQPDDWEVVRLPDDSSDKGKGSRAGENN